LTHTEIISSLKKKDYQPIYFLHGLESYFIDTVSDYIEKNVLSDAERGFNQTIMYGKDVTDIKMIKDVAMRYPMMSEYQVLIIKEAQDLKGIDKLSDYVKQPSPKTILVFCFRNKKLNLNTKFGKLLKANAVVLDAKPMYDNQVPDWISKYLKSAGLNINPQNANLLAEYLGTDLSKVANEIDKLAINLPKGAEVTSEIIESNIGISREYNSFEFQKAIAAKDIVKSTRIVNYFIANPKKGPIQMLVGTLYNFFSKVYMYHFVKSQSEGEVLKQLGLRSNWFLKEYKVAARNFNRLQVEKVIETIKEYDLKSKGVNFNSTTSKPGDLLKEMTWKILH